MRGASASECALGQGVLTAVAPDTLAAPPARLPATLRQLTRFTSGAFDPYWADGSHLVFSAFEDFRFTVRQIDADSLAAAPVSSGSDALPAPAAPWAFARYAATDSTGTPEPGRPYRRRYQLDVAQGGVTTATTASYAAGGATLLFSDLLGDDRIFVTAYSSNTSGGGRGFFESLNLAVTRIHLGRRAHYGYGVFRLAGPRYDRTDPTTPSGIPSFETVHGALGIVSYPISFFRRVELETSFGLGTKQGLFRSPFGGTSFDTLRTAQLSNTLTLVHDNTLFAGPVYGPSEGWRANVSAGYTTDVANSNESYYTLGADARHYAQLAPGVTFASWGLVRTNVGRRARLNLLGGAWSLRGFPFLRVRGQSLWFTSQELRFPIANRPPLVYPIFSGLRGALFADVAHNWSGGYSDRFEDPDYPDLSIGSTKGSIGAGARVALLGAIVLRYDIGWRFRDGLQWGEREPFSQIFFGYDF